MLVIKTGMASEFRVAKKYAAADVLVLTGILTVDALRKSVPSNARAIISLGLCGGLAPSIAVGDVVLAGIVDTPDGEYETDRGWTQRLYECTGALGVRWWSSGDFNTANNKIERDALFAKTRCQVIDDETFAVAQFAKERKLALAALRSVSDGEHDNLPPAVVDALNANGTDNLEAVIWSVVTDPLQVPALVKTALEYKKSMDALDRVCRQVGSNFQWND